MDETPLPSSELEPIPGDTFPLRSELKALGAVWDPAARVWSIASDKLPLAIALVDNQNLIPTPKTTEELIDPFEDEGEGTRLVALEKSEGATYDARDALRIVGARWDKTRRSWLIREDRSDYARAILAAVATSPTKPPQPLGTEVSEPPRSTLPEVRPSKHSSATPARQDEAADVLSGRNPESRIPPAELSKAATIAGRIPLGGLWLKRGKDGREYLSGNLSPSVKILVFKNTFKTGEKQPSHVMYLAPGDQEEPQQ